LAANGVRDSSQVRDAATDNWQRSSCSPLPLPQFIRSHFDFGFGRVSSSELKPVLLALMLISCSSLLLCTVLLVSARLFWSHSSRHYLDARRVIHVVDNGLMVVIALARTATRFK
jgi:hypothetical protein